MLRLGTFFGLMIAAVAIGLGSMTSASAEKSVTLSPSSGIVGTAVEATFTGGKPGTPITVIFKIPGDPVLATGTLDDTGSATFNFTIPWTPGGTYTIFFTDFSCACQVGVPFTVTVQRQTPTPTATPTTPPTSTPIPTTTQPPAATETPTAIAATPTATPTPRVPVLGTTDDFGGLGGPNVGVLGLGFLAVVTVLAWFAATRRDGGTALAVAAPVPTTDDEPDAYSTEPDFAALEGLRKMRPFSGATAPRDERRTAWAIGAGIAATASALFLLRRK